VDRIYLYDHDSSTPLADGLEDLIEQGLLVVERFEGHHKKFKGMASGSFRATAQVHEAQGARCWLSTCNMHGDQIFQFWPCVIT